MANTFPVYYILLVSICVLSVVYEADPRNETSCFSFIYTDEDSPTNLESTCFEMPSSKVNHFYLGISFYVMAFNDTNDSSCTFGNIKLETLKKSIILHGTRKQRLCRMDMIFSVNKAGCVDNIRNLKSDCVGKNQTTEKLFFQNCTPVQCPEEKLASKKNINGTDALLLSQFPEPKYSDSGLPAYDIPTAHCDRGQCKQDNCSTEQFKKLTKNKSVHVNTPKKTEDTQCVFSVIESGGSGLLIGILLTSVIWFLLNKYKKNCRHEGFVSFSKQNVHLLPKTERNLSIHSKEGETVYHDISDVPGPSKVKAIQPGVSNFLPENSPEERYSESPNSSTSASENGSISSQLSTMRVPAKVEKDSQKSEKTQIYHALVRDYKVNSRNVIKSASKRINGTVTENHYKKETSSTKEGQQYSVYESPVAQHSVLISQTVVPDSADLSNITNKGSLETNDKVVESLPSVYHPLEVERGGILEDMPIEMKSKVGQNKRSSNGDSSQGEYYMIMAKSPEPEHSSSES